MPLYFFDVQSINCEGRPHNLSQPPERCLILAMHHIKPELRQCGWFRVEVLAGMALFFILERTGVVYQWFDKWDQ